MTSQQRVDGEWICDFVSVYTMAGKEQATDRDHEQYSPTSGHPAHES